MRVAIYARYSSDRQNERSIDDQIAVCAAHATRRNWTVITAYTDAAISAATMANRPGLLSMLAAADRREFDLVLVEDQDRLARNREHDAHVFNRLNYAGIGIATLSTDRVTVIESAFKGLMNELYLSALSDKTKRGMHSNAEKGLATGSRLFGYRSEPGGMVTIVEAEAEAIREICAAYAGGASPRQIASDLNSRDVPSPRGGTWNASSINGSVQRANGILNTELYAGVKVFNRIEMRKDPVSGKRISKPRPESEWRRIDVPHLRIVSAEIWSQIRARKAAEAGKRPVELRRRRPGVFSGLLKCAQCGATMTVYDQKRRLICAAFREKGPAVCSNGRTVSRVEVETRVLEGLRTRLLAPAAVAAYVRIYHEAWMEKSASNRASIAPVTKRIAELSRSIERLVDAICDGTATASMKQRLVDQEAEKEELQARLGHLQTQTPPPIQLHPKAAERFAERIGQLQAALADRSTREDAVSEEMIEATRGLIDRVTIQATGPGRDAPVNITLHGTLAAFLRPRNGEAAPEGVYKVVAGGRYRLTHAPPTYDVAC